MSFLPQELHVAHEEWKHDHKWGNFSILDSASWFGKQCGNGMMSSICSDRDLALRCVFFSPGRTETTQTSSCRQNGRSGGVRPAREQGASFHTVTLTTVAVRPHQRGCHGGLSEGCVEWTDELGHCVIEKETVVPIKHNIKTYVSAQAATLCMELWDEKNATCYDQHHSPLTRLCCYSRKYLWWFAVFDKMNTSFVPEPFSP